MEQLTIRVQEDILEEIEEKADVEDTTKSAVAREYLKLGTEYENLQAEYDDLQTENERLQNRIRKLIDMHNEHDELVRYVEENRTLQRQKHEASAIDRLKWIVFGGGRE